MQRVWLPSGFPRRLAGWCLRAEDATAVYLSWRRASHQNRYALCVGSGVRQAAKNLPSGDATSRVERSLQHCLRLTRQKNARAPHRDLRRRRRAEKSRLACLSSLLGLRRAPPPELPHGHFPIICHENGRGRGGCASRQRRDNELERSSQWDENLLKLIFSEYEMINHAVNRFLSSANPPFLPRHRFFNRISSSLLPLNFTFHDYSPLSVIRW
ncbi:unnamed protein product [Caenorhabditis auriculariae]|uniref:Uncharacterized protein n=1 Tax=Caenorhabditis auriculariae TaxID=2777116 RepID=A0A8S1GZK7_9PELO|nr:unnamed protein product [Caenorhabditis auriculariae]